MPEPPGSAPTAASDLRWLLKWYFGVRARMLFRRPFTPPTLNLLVTLRCDMRCRHCFLWAQLEDAPRADELAPAEIEALARSMGPLFSLVISGGEPFLRKDLAEIARVFHEHNRVKVLTLLTGGQMTGRVREVVREILARSPEILVVVGVSLDGVGARHDEIRQKSGAFDRAVRTVRMLKDLAASEPRVSVQACTCLTGLNQDHIFDLYAYLRDDLRPDRIAVNLVRQDAPDPRAREFDPAVYERLVRQVREDTCSGRLRNRFGFDRFAFMTVADLRMTRLIAATLRTGRPQVRCRAGSVSAVVFPDGSVFPCEMKPGWGNLREFDFDFRRFWTARRAQARREGTLPGRTCFCTHEIDCFLPSIPFDAGLYPGLAREWARAARGQWRVQDRPGRFSVVAVSPEGPGACEARNLGARAADAPDLLFLDPGFAAPPGFLGDLARFMRGAGLALAVVRAGDPFSGRVARGLWRRVPARLRRFLERWLPVGPRDAIAVRREVFDAAGGFRPSDPAPERALVRRCRARVRWDVVRAAQLAGRRGAGPEPG